MITLLALAELRLGTPAQAHDAGIQVSTLDEVIPTTSEGELQVRRLSALRKSLGCVGVVGTRGAEQLQKVMETRNGTGSSCTFASHLPAFMKALHAACHKRGPARISKRSNNSIATSNKCLTSSNKKLVETSATLVGLWQITQSSCPFHPGRLLRAARPGSNECPRLPRNGIARWRPTKPPNKVKGQSHVNQLCKRENSEESSSNSHTSNLLPKRMMESTSRCGPCLFWRQAMCHRRATARNGCVGWAGVVELVKRAADQSCQSVDDVWRVELGAGSDWTGTAGLKIHQCSQQNRE